MDYSYLLPVVAESKPYVVIIYLVFLYLTRPRQGRTGDTVRNGRTRRPPVGIDTDRETE
jgi:hypothetical protein